MRKLLLFLVLPGFTFAQAKPQKPEDFTIVRDGTMPVILSAPHGGRMPIPGSPLRLGTGVDKFATVRDDNTDELAQMIAAGLEKKLGLRPFVVIAKFERKYADANREASNAYESDPAKPIYEYYHKSLAKARDTVKAKWTTGLVIDIHGQGAEIDTIFRGTANQKSVTHLIDRHGMEALTGPKSLFGHLAGQGVRVHPEIGSRDKESKQYNGGYIVQHYGSADGGAIDAIQMEFGSSLRRKPRIDQTAAAVVDAIAAFAGEYLPAQAK